MSESVKMNKDTVIRLVEAYKDKARSEIGTQPGRMALEAMNVNPHMIEIKALEQKINHELNEMAREIIETLAGKGTPLKNTDGTVMCKDELRRQFGYAITPASEAIVSRLARVFENMLDTWANKARSDKKFDEVIKQIKRLQSAEKVHEILSKIGLGHIELDISGFAAGGIDYGYVNNAITALKALPAATEAAESENDDEE